MPVESLFLFQLKKQAHDTHFSRQSRASSSQQATLSESPLGGDVLRLLGVRAAISSNPVSGP